MTEDTTFQTKSEEEIDFDWEGVSFSFHVPYEPDHRPHTARPAKDIQGMRAHGTGQLLDGCSFLLFLALAPQF